MICFPHAKINLGLSVVARRRNGFHEVETILYPVPLCDILEIIVSPDKKFRFRSSGLETGCAPENNLVVKTYRLLQTGFGLPPVAIHLHKAIPSGAGLGGGSSDAAFTLRTLNTLFQLKLSDTELEDYARKLGTDCAFFIRGKPVFASGRGDRFEPLSADLSSCRLAIVKPAVHISTADAYTWIKPAVKNVHLSDILRQPIITWHDKLVNDFEPEVFRRYPEIKAIKDRLYDLGALYASMSGSGSAVYAIFSKPVKLKDHFPGCFVWMDRK